MKDNASRLLIADSHISKISAFNQNNPDCKQNGTNGHDELQTNRISKPFQRITGFR